MSENGYRMSREDFDGKLFKNATSNLFFLPGMSVYHLLCRVDDPGGNFSCCLEYVHKVCLRKIRPATRGSHLTVPGEEPHSVNRFVLV